MQDTGWAGGTERPVGLTRGAWGEEGKRMWVCTFMWGVERRLKTKDGRQLASSSICDQREAHIHWVHVSHVIGRENQCVLEVAERQPMLGFRGVKSGTAIATGSKQSRKVHTHGGTKSGRQMWGRLQVNWGKPSAAGHQTRVHALARMGGPWRQDVSRAHHAHRCLSYGGRHLGRAQPPSAPQVAPDGSSLVWFGGRRWA